MLTYGQKVTYILRLRKVSAKHLAEQLGITPAMVSKVETGKSRFGDANLSKMCKILDIPIDFFLVDNVETLDDLLDSKKAKKILANKNSLGFVVLADMAESGGLTKSELENAINYAIMMKKAGMSN